MTAPMKGEPAPPGAEALLRDASARADRLLSGLSGQHVGLPLDGLAAWSRAVGAVERVRASLNDALRRAEGPAPDSRSTADDNKRGPACGRE